MGARKTTMLVIIVTVILLTVQVSAVAGAGSDDKEPQLDMRVHYLYKKSPAKGGTPGAPGGNAKPPKDDDGTYKTYGKGVVWKDLPIVMTIDTSIDASSRAAIWDGAMEWEDYTSTNLFDDGGYETGSGLTWDGDTGDTPDGYNEIVFENYDDSNVIAITVVWGYFGGPPAFREIIEFDILFNTDFVWGDADDPDTYVMDVWNIATHEIGHGLGLADLYEDADNKETMYGYASYEETIKRDLYLGDIAGIQSLYGKV